MYQPRKISALPRYRLRHWRWKRYGITLTGQEPGPELVAVADGLLARSLLAGALEAAHDLGFSIIHAGRDVNFIVLGYWVNGNELAVEVYKAPLTDPLAFRRADTNASSVACVWDLAVISHERQAWIRSVLAPGHPDPDAYLADVIDGFY